MKCNFVASLFVSVGVLAGCSSGESTSPQVDEGSELRTRSCLFPSTLGELQRSATLKPKPYIEWSWQEVQRRGLENDQPFGTKFVDAVRVAKPSVHTFADAFAAVDGGVIQEKSVFDKTGSRMFHALLFEVQGKSFGVIVDHGTDDRVSEIVDGAIRSCTVKPQTCAFRQSFRATLRLDTLEHVEEKTTIASADGISEKRKAQILAASNSIRGSQPFATVEDVFAQADEPFSAWVLRDTGSRQKFTAIEFVSGNGDTRTAVIFRGETTDVLATYDADDMNGNCKTFRR